MSEQQVSSEELWEQIGFHKNMGGFWYKLLFNIVMISISGVVSGFLINFLYPFPESWGYRDIAAGLFIPLFKIFDFGTMGTMDRYIAEAQIKDPSKMVKYLQYFIWYQMITGLIQATIVSTYALFIVPKTSLSYTVWLMLLLIMPQYPGFLNVFRNTLASLQYHNKAELLKFFTSEIFQRITEVGFVLLGGYLGKRNPAIGQLMGIAIGSAFGVYIDDFFAAVISARMFSKVMKKRGIQVKDCFRIDFDWKFIIEPMKFGLKTGIATLPTIAANFILLRLFISFIPQYSTFLILASVGSSVAWMMVWADGISITTLVSEAYLNGKKELTQHYLGQKLRFTALMQGFLLEMVLVMKIFLPEMFLTFNLENYYPALLFVVPATLNFMKNPYASTFKQVIYGTHNPNFMIVSSAILETLKVGFAFLFVDLLQLPVTYGFPAIVWIIAAGQIPAELIVIFINSRYIDKKLFKIKIPIWQAFVVPLLAMASTYIIGRLFIFLAFDVLYNLIGFIGALVVGMAFLMMFQLVVYFPMTALLGGWDTHTLADFKMAAKMSGPSKFFVWPIYLIVQKVCSLSPLHNRFGMDYTVPEKQARELYELKMKNAINK